MQQLEQGLAERIIEERDKNGPYEDFQHFLSRISAGIQQLTNLIRAGAFWSFGISKKELLWMAHYKLNSETYRKLPRFLPPLALFQGQAQPLEISLTTNGFDDYLDEIELLNFSAFRSF